MTIWDTMQEMATALEPLQTQIEGLQIVPYLNANPTPPSIDIYPGEPFQEGAGMGLASMKVFFTVRARVSTADEEAGNHLLIRLMDPTDPASVEAALLGADVASIGNDGGVSGFREYLEDVSGNGRLLGCDWRVSTYL